MPHYLLFCKQASPRGRRLGRVGGSFEPPLIEPCVRFCLWAIPTVFPHTALQSSSPACYRSSVMGFQREGVESELLFSLESGHSVYSPFIPRRDLCLRLYQYRKRCLRKRFKVTTSWTLSLCQTDKEGVMPGPNSAKRSASHIC